MFAGKRKRSGDRGLNLSVTAAIAADLPHMARRLVGKIRRMKGWREEWKLVGLEILMMMMAAVIAADLPHIARRLVGRISRTRRYGPLSGPTSSSCGGFFWPFGQK